VIERASAGAAVAESQAYAASGRAGAFRMQSGSAADEVARKR